jgi:hypothetical protein
VRGGGGGGTGDRNNKINGRAENNWRTRYFSLNVYYFPQTIEYDNNNNHFITILFYAARPRMYYTF